MTNVTTTVDAGEVEPVLVLDKMNKDLVKRALEKLKLPVGGSFAARAKRLDDHYRAVEVPQAELIQCVECNGHSSELMPECPFCGHHDASEPGAAHTNGVNGKANGANGNGKASLVVLEAAGETVPEVISGSTPGARRSNDEIALDVATARILTLKNQVAKDYWQIGRELDRVHAPGGAMDPEKKSLWLARTDAGGKVLYKSFEQYTKAELQIPREQAYDLINVSKRYSAALMERVGVSKLAVVLSAPEDVRDALMEEVEAGASYRDLRKKVRQTKKAKGVKQVQRVEGGKLRGVNPKPRVAKVTVASVEGAVVLPLYAKPKVALAAGELPAKRAKRLADRPIAYETLDNGVARYYSVVAKASGWVLKIETKRLAK